MTMVIEMQKFISDFIEGHPLVRLWLSQSEDVAMCMAQVSILD